MIIGLVVAVAVVLLLVLRPVLAASTTKRFAVRLSVLMRQLTASGETELSRDVDAVTEKIAAAKGLRALFAEASRRGRLAAIAPIVEPQVPAIIDVLQKSLETNEKGLHYELVMALGQLGPLAVDAVPDILRQITLVDQPDLKEGIAYKAIDQIGRAALPTLDKLCLDKTAEKDLRRAAKEAVRRIDPKLADKYPNV